MANLPTTLTTTAHGVFASAGKESDEHIFYAPSPQGDLAGRPAIRWAHQLTKADIRRGLLSFTAPEYDSGSGLYIGESKANLTLNRRNASTTASNLALLVSLIEVLAITDVKEAFVSAAL